MSQCSIRQAIAITADGFDSLNVVLTLTFFLTQGRHYFAAETLPEMKEWVNAINSAMKNRSRKDKRVLRDGSLTPGQSKVCLCFHCFVIWRGN